MRSNNIIFYLLVTLVLLLGVYWLSTRDLDQSASLVAYLSSTEDVDVAQVDTFTITTSEGKLMGAKKDSSWWYENYLLDNERISLLLNSLIEPTSVELVSETTTQHNALEVGASPSAQLSIKSGEASLDLVLGARQRGGAYVRFADEDVVYLLSNVSDFDSVNFRDWIDLFVVRTSENDLKRIKISGNQSFDLSQVGGKWFLNDGDQPLQRASIAELLATLTMLQATQPLLSDEASDYASTASLIVTLQLDEERQLELAFYKGADDWKVDSSERTSSFVLPSSKIQPILDIDPAAFEFEIEEEDVPLLGE